MKFCIDQFSSDRSGFPKCGYWVYLDGKHCFYAQMADDEVGIVRAPLIDDDAKPIIDVDEYAIRERRGKVEIIPLHEPFRFTEAEFREWTDGNPFHVSTERGFV